MSFKTYTELKSLKTYEERLAYLQSAKPVGEKTFGFERYLNQAFYHSREWELAKNHVIARDYGNDLGIDGVPIAGKIFVHHMNPIGKEDIMESSDILLNPEYLISVSHDTHLAIHYGSAGKQTKPTERTPNDTCPWRK